MSVLVASQYRVEQNQRSVVAEDNLLNFHDWIVGVLKRTDQSVDGSEPKPGNEEGRQLHVYRFFDNSPSTDLYREGGCWFSTECSLFDTGWLLTREVYHQYVEGGDESM